MIIVAQIVFGLSVLGILFFIGRRIPDILKFPRYSEKENGFYEEVQEQWGKLKEKSKASEFLHDTIFPVTEKFLRRIKIVLLKLDNFLAKKANKLRHKIRKRKEENGENNNLPR